MSNKNIISELVLLQKTQENPFLMLFWINIYTITAHRFFLLFLLQMKKLQPQVTNVLNG